MNMTTQQLPGYLSRIFPAVFFLLFSIIAVAEVPQPNGQYGGGTVIEYPSNGVSYVLPSNAIGITSPNTPEAELIVGILPHYQTGDNGLFVQVGVADFQAVAEEMNHAVLFMDAELQPVAKASVGDGVVYNDFQYEEHGRQFSAFMLLVSLENDSSVMFVASAPPQLIQLYKDMIVEVAKSIKISEPVAVDEAQASDEASGGGQRPSISQSQNGSVVMGEKCSFASAGGMTVKICD